MKISKDECRINVSALEQGVNAGDTLVIQVERQSTVYTWLQVYLVEKAPAVYPLHRVTVAVAAVLDMNYDNAPKAQSLRVKRYSHPEAEIGRGIECYLKLPAKSLRAQVI